MAAVASLFNSRNMNATANRSNWSTIMSYLKSHSSFLGLKQDRFTILLPSGLPDYSFEMVNNEQVKKVKVNRPKALCFDYLQLKEAFDWNWKRKSFPTNKKLWKIILRGRNRQMYRYRAFHHSEIYLYSI